MKTAIMSILYVFVLLLGLALFNLTFTYFLHDVVIEVFNWFNGLGLLMKVIVFLLGAGLAYAIIFGIYAMVVRSIGNSIYSAFPLNLFTIIVCGLFMMLNLGYWLREIYYVIHIWNFWSLMEFILVASFVVGLHSIFLPAKTSSH